MENTEKVYTQAEVDAMMLKAKENQQSQFERKYVSKEDYGALETKYNELVKATKSQGIKGAFMNLGGLENSFDDMLALNPNLLNIEDNKQLVSELSKIKEHKPYFFDNVYRQFQNNDVFNQSNTMVDDSQVMSDMLNAKPNKLYTNTIVALEGEDENNKFV